MAAKFKPSAIVIPVDGAVGMVLAHDITEIRPGVFKGPAFKKGHISEEVHEGRIEDKFAPVVREKIGLYGCRLRQIISFPMIKKELSMGSNNCCLQVVLSSLQQEE